MMKVLLVYNPNAGRRKAEKQYPKVRDLLPEYGIRAETVFTESPGHAIHIVENAELHGYDGIVVAGGDGTLFEAVNGYFRNPSAKRIPLGVIPVGTGNSFSRELNVSSGNPEEAIAIIKNRQRKRVDLGRFTLNHEDWYFINILGLGFVTDVLDTAVKCKGLGESAYTIGVLAKLIFLKNYDLEITLDGKLITQRNVLVEVANSRITGGNFLMAPGAVLDDGLLDVVLLKKLSRRRLLRIFPKLFKGTHGEAEEVDVYRAREIEIKTGTPKKLSPDGELMGSTPLKITCLQKAIEMFWK